jgi:hypothetical protein
MSSSYKVTAPLVIIANADGTSGDWYGYVDAVVPAGLNDERCKQLAKEGMLAKVDTPTDSSSGSSDKVDDILADVGEDPEKAAAALETEKAGKNRTTLVSKLEAIVAGGNS